MSWDESRVRRSRDGQFTHRPASPQDGRLEPEPAPESGSNAPATAVSDGEWNEALRDLHQAGITADPAELPEWHAETGHWFTLDHPDERFGKDDWGVVIKHPGDPSGHSIRVGLGPGHTGIGQRVLQALARPDVMREMTRQMQRAGWAGDPDGTIAAHGGPGRFSEERTEFTYSSPSGIGDRPD